MKDEKNKIAVITEQDLSLIDVSMLNAKQAQLLLKKTPSVYVKTRPAKGGGKWEYVTGGYVKKVLNLMFGFNWDFEIMDQMIEHGEVIVKGKLTCRCGDNAIIKMQYGNKEVMYKKEGKDKDGNRIPLSIGNDFKAAATDALKKCAAEIGIAADIYNKEDFREVQIKGVESKTKRYG